MRHVDVDAYLVAYHYNPVRRGLRRDSLPLAREKGVAMIVAGAFAGIPLGPDSDWVDSRPSRMSSEEWHRCLRLREIHQESGLSMVALCVRYLIADPDVSVVLVGAAAPAEIEESVFAAYEGPLPPDIHEAVEGIVAKDRW